MKEITVYRKIFLGFFVMIPNIGNCKTTNAMSSYEIGFMLLAGFCLFVILGALLSIFKLNVMLMNVEKERYGVPKKSKPEKPIWNKIKDRLTDVVPVEKEKHILLAHNYDGIQELDNNLPPWWLYGFYLSIIFGVFYIGYYHTYGYGPSSIEEYEEEIQLADIAVSNYIERQANTIDESNLIALTDGKSLELGLAVFSNNCVTCHMKGGGGSSISVGPNLTDKYWLHGGDIKGIFKTIKYGIPDKGMIAWKAQLNPADMHRVASYILSLQGTNPPHSKEPQGDFYEANLESANIEDK